MNAASNVNAIVSWLRGTAPGAQLSSDSRSIGVGDVFFAYPGDAADGRNYIDSAIEAGAKAVVYEAEGFAWSDQWAQPRLAVQGLKQIAGPVANTYYGQPDAAMFSVAVTGTNGKT